VWASWPIRETLQEIEMAHTPGPWRIGAPPPNGEQTIGTNYGLMVAVATTGVGVESIANARLIAAAPDLLESIKNYFEVYENRDREPGWVKRIFDAKEKCMAAIAKATGEQ
jgi:hypothetical protein